MKIKNVYKIRVNNKIFNLVWPYYKGCAEYTGAELLVAYLQTKGIKRYDIKFVIPSSL